MQLYLFLSKFKVAPLIVKSLCAECLFGCCPPSDRLLFVINAIKEEIVVRVEDSSPRPTNMTDTLEHLIQETLGENNLQLTGNQK